MSHIARPAQSLPHTAQQQLLEVFEAFGEMYIAMGRPALTADMPVAGFVEGLREAKRRFEEGSVLQESTMGQRIRQLEMENAALKHSLHTRDQLISSQVRALVERSHDGQAGEVPTSVLEVARELSKWLNEQPNRDVDRLALATLVNYVNRLTPPTA